MKKEKADSLMEKEAFNIVASDKISLERSVKDVRDARYNTKSIYICLYNILKVCFVCLYLYMHRY